MVPQPHHPQELHIDPEGLEVANCYLTNPSAHKVADLLDLPLELVVTTLRRPEVKRYIDHVFQETGFNNRHTLRRAMDKVLELKFQELDDSGVGSSKDIAELLLLSHKMRMEELEFQLKVEKAAQGTPKVLGSQVNVQINDSGSNYGNLLEKLMKGST